MKFTICSMGCEVVLTSIHHLNNCYPLAGDWHWKYCCPLAGDRHWNDCFPLGGDWHW